jgi:hypothetical protein
LVALACFHTGYWLDFDMIETWREWDKIHPAVLVDALLSLRKPSSSAKEPTRTGPIVPGTR